MEHAGPGLEQLPDRIRTFAPVHSCGGLIAAVGVLLFSVAGLFTTLPGSPLAASYPIWLVWALRFAPLPALVLLWAVAHEAEYKVRADSSAIHFRQPLGGSVRVPWREVTDYFADCGRNPQAVAASGGSLVDDGSRATAETAAAPFASHGPDYTLWSSRGTFVFDDGLADVALLAREVSSNAPDGAPDRWEEASWLTCRRCDERTAVSLWPSATGDSIRYCDRCRAPHVSPTGDSEPVACACGGEFVQEEFTCPACGEPFGEALLASEEQFTVERRGSLEHPRPWAVTAVQAEGDASPPPPEPTEGVEGDESV